jgi:predicted DNA repair protein MutK
MLSGGSRLRIIIAILVIVFFVPLLSTIVLVGGAMVIALPYIVGAVIIIGGLYFIFRIVGGVLDGLADLSEQKKNEKTNKMQSTSQKKEDDNKLTQDEIDLLLRGEVEVVQRRRNM